MPFKTQINDLESSFLRCVSRANAKELRHVRVEAVLKVEWFYKARNSLCSGDTADSSGANCGMISYLNARHSALLEKRYFMEWHRIYQVDSVSGIPVAPALDREMEHR